MRSAREEVNFVIHSPARGRLTSTTAVAEARAMTAKDL